MKATKIVTIYYLQYPDCPPKDPLHAATEAYVEVGNESSTTDHFMATYAFKIFTMGYLRQQISENKKPYLLDRSVIIVDKFDDDTIRTAVLSIIEEIDFYGLKKHNKL